MFRDSQGFLAIWAEPPADVIPEYLDWLANEHVPERVSTPGFLNGRIFEDVDHGGRFFVVYETVAAEVLSSPAYLARGEAPSDWTQRMVRKLNPIVRGAGRIAWAGGQGWGGAVAVTRFDGPDAVLSLDGGLGEELCRVAGVVSVRFLVTDQGITGIGTAEKRLRPVADAGFSAALVIEGVDLEAVGHAQGVLGGVRGQENLALDSPLFARMRFGLTLAQITAPGGEHGVGAAKF